MVVAVWRALGRVRLTVLICCGLLVGSASWAAENYGRDLVACEGKVEGGAGALIRQAQIRRDLEQPARDLEIWTPTIDVDEAAVEALAREIFQELLTRLPIWVLGRHSEGLLSPELRSALHSYSRILARVRLTNQVLDTIEIPFPTGEEQRKQWGELVSKVAFFKNPEMLFMAFTPNIVADIARASREDVNFAPALAAMESLLKRITIWDLQPIMANVLDFTRGGTTPNRLLAVRLRRFLLSNKYFSARLMKVRTTLSPERDEVNLETLDKSGYIRWLPMTLYAAGEGTLESVTLNQVDGDEAINQLFGRHKVVLADVSILVPGAKVRSNRDVLISTPVRLTIANDDPQTRFKLFAVEILRHSVSVFDASGTIVPTDDANRAKWPRRFPWLTW